jgi:hypothetical protein
MKTWKCSGIMEVLYRLVVEVLRKTTKSVAEDSRCPG